MLSHATLEVAAHVHSQISDSDSFFNGIATFVGYLMPNPSFEKNSYGTI